MPIPLQRVVQKTFLRVGSATLSAAGTVGSYTNLPPVWTTVPIISFTQGLGEDKSVDAYESDPNPGETTSVSYIGGTLPNGVTFVSASKVYRYDGIQAPGSTDTSRLRSTDNGVPVLSADSNLHRVEIVSNLQWSTTPAPSFVELTTTSYNLGQHIPNYSAATDEFSVDPVGTQLTGANAWLSLTGTGGVNLTPNGTQVDASDFSGLILRVRRSGGAWVSSAAFGVTVTAAQVVAPSGNRVLLSDRYDGPDWLQASSYLAINWANSGGDYKDVNDVSQGPSAFASASVTSGTAGQVKTWNVAALVEKLRVENTGIYIKTTAGGGNIQFASKENGTYQGPQLSVTISGTVYNCPILSDIYIDASASVNAIVDSFNNQLRSPMLLKFDLSGLPPTGTVSAATLTLTQSGAGSASYPATFAAFRLYPPVYYTAPELELGGVEYGIAQTLAADSGLGGHSSVVAYDNFASLAQINNGNWRWVPRNSGTWANGASFGTFTDLSLPAAEVTVEPGVGWGTSGNSVAKLIRTVYPPAWHNTLDGAADNPLTPPNRPWCLEWADILNAPQEAYLRYVFEIDEDADFGLAQDSGINMVRMARLSSVLEDLSGGTTPENIGPQQFSYAIGWGGKGFRPRLNPSTHGPIFRGMLYAYDFQDWTEGHGNPKITFEPNICFRAGKTYTIEQYVKLNTWNGQGNPLVPDNTGANWNADGIIRIWVNGVRVLNITNRKIRVHSKDRIFFLPWGDFFAIGPINPSGQPYHFKFGAMAVTTDKTAGGAAYIGPAQEPLPTWAQGATLNAWMNIGTAKWNDVGEPSTISTAPAYCHPGVQGARLGDYSGPWYNPKTRTMVLGPAGGHGGYFHNWMTSINVGANTPAASLFHAGSPWQHMIQDSEYYGDTTPGLTAGQRQLRPTATHTYYSLRFCKERDWLILWGPTSAGNGELPLCPADWPWKIAAPFNPPPGPWPASRVPIAFDYNTMEWISPSQSPVAQIPIASGGNWTAFPCTVDPRNGDVYYNMDGASNSGLWVWRQATNTHVRLNSSNGPHNYRATAVDPTRNQLFSTGGYPFRQGGTVFPYNQASYGAKVFDLSTGAVTFLTMSGPAANLVCETFLLDGNNQPLNDRVSYGYPEMFYCVPLGKYVLCSNPNGDYPDVAKRNTTVLISIDPTSWYCDFIATTNNPGVMAGASGVDTKFIMDESMRGALLSDQYDQPLKYIKLW